MMPQDWKLHRMQHPKPIEQRAPVSVQAAQARAETALWDQDDSAVYAAAQEVLALHAPQAGGSYGTGLTCSSCGDRDEAYEWPCATIEILTGLKEADLPGS